MLDVYSLLSDPAARTLVSIIALVVAVITFLVGQWWWRRKALAYSVSKTRLLRLHDEARGRVQITFDGVPAEAVSLIEITISNSGHEPIKAADFAGPLRMRVGKNAELLSFEVTEQRPQDLAPCVAVEGNDLVLEPLLLNRGDSFTIKTLVNGVGDIQIRGRISGVSSIKEGIPDVLSTLGTLGSLAGAALLGIALLLVPPALERPPTPPYVFELVGIGVILMYGGLFLAIRSRVRRILRSLLH